MVLILSGGINLTPGPVTRHQINDPKVEAFNNKGLHLIHLNINSLLLKIDELRNIVKCSSAAVIGITETKFDNTVYDSGVTIDGYSIARNDGNRKCGGVACYSRKTYLFDNLENIFIDLLFLKTKPISVGIIYKTPSQTQFLEQMITEFQALELNNKLHILGDFNINLLFKGNAFLVKLTQLKTIVRTFLNLGQIKNYNELFSIYGFKQLMNCPTRIICNTFTLIDHILTNRQDSIS